MNIQKFTQKSLEAIQSAQTIATENQNSQVEQEHLLLALLEQENSLIKELLKKMGKDVLEQAVKNKINLYARKGGLFSVRKEMIQNETPDWLTLYMKMVNNQNQERGELMLYDQQSRKRKDYSKK